MDSSLYVFLALLIVFESVALYCLRRYQTQPNKPLFFLVACLLYGLVVTYLLYRLITMEQSVGIVNFVWNVFSTMAGFLLGVYIFNEHPAPIQWIGVALGILAFGLIVLGSKKPQQALV